MTDLSGTPMPSIFVQAPLPKGGAELWLLVVVLMITAFCLHAWIRGHIRRHGFPPVALLRWWGGRHG